MQLTYHVRLPNDRLNISRYSAVRIKGKVYEKEQRNYHFHKATCKIGISSTCANLLLSRHRLSQIFSMDPQTEEVHTAENNEPSPREERSERVLLSAVLTLVLSILGRWVVLIPGTSPNSN